MGAPIPTGRNMFDYGARYPTDAVLLFRFNKEHHRRYWLREGSLHEMCNEEGYGSVECRPFLDLRISKVKVYQELIHEILSCMPRRALDDMPSTTRAVRTQAR